jgi:hypothetical protein
MPYLGFPFTATHGQPDLRYEFLEAYQQSHADLAAEICRALEEPEAEWVSAWKDTLLREYLQWTKAESQQFLA